MATQLSRRSFFRMAGGLGTALALGACTGGGSDVAAPPKGVPDTPGTLMEPLDNGYSSGLHHAVIEMEGYGKLELELYGDNTPITVSNFADLAEAGFYDGLGFHRIIKGFMVQGGDPKGDGTGGSTRRIKGEFSANGVVNAIQHKRGVISMARSQEPNSASSQFFIMHADYPSLDGQYAAFGRVTSGIEVIDALVEVPVQDSNGTVSPADQPKIVSLKMVD